MSFSLVPSVALTCRVSSIWSSFTAVLVFFFKNLTDIKTPRAPLVNEIIRLNHDDVVGEIDEIQDEAVRTANLSCDDEIGPHVGKRLAGVAGRRFENSSQACQSQQPKPAFSIEQHVKTHCRISAIQTVALCS